MTGYLARNGCSTWEESQALAEQRRAQQRQAREEIDRLEKAERERQRAEQVEREKVLQERQAEEDKRLRQERALEAKVQVPAFLARREAFIESLLDHVGVPRQIRDATFGQVQPVIQSALEGRAKHWSFGLVGPVGTGKSCAVVGLLRARIGELLDKWMKEKIDEYMARKSYWLPKGLGEEAPTIPFRWCAWRREVEFNRGQIGADYAAVESWINGLIEHNGPLVLDDLGAEPQQGRRWAEETLGRVIDARHGDDLPTIWTGNLDFAAMVSKYGSRTADRLFQGAPPIVLPEDLPSLRPSSWSGRRT